MITLNKLRILIVLLWTTYLAQVLSFEFYDPTLYSPILHLAKILLSRAVNLDKVYFFFLVMEAALLIYSSAALWFGYLTGKWTYIVYVMLALFDNYFLIVQAFSWIDIFLVDLYFLITGMICLTLFLPPIKQLLNKQKPFMFWKVFGAFFIFFTICFGLPLSISYLFS